MLGTALLERRGLDVEAVDRIVNGAIGGRDRVVGTAVLSSRGRTSELAQTMAVQLESGRELVLKLRSPATAEVFAIEAHQLRHLAARAPFRVPEVVAMGRVDDGEPVAYLVLERLAGLNLRRARGALLRSQRERLQLALGATLGRLHRNAVGDRFGEIVPDSSPRHRSWPQCFARRWQGRLELLKQGDWLSSRVLAALECIHARLPDLLCIDDVPRLLHGNLAPSRVLCCADLDGLGWCVNGMLEPALEYGHHELDLALLELHRSVDAAFLAGYRSELAIDPGYHRRKLVYMLYATLERVRSDGHTHQILQAIELVNGVLQLAAERR